MKPIKCEARKRKVFFPFLSGNGTRHCQCGQIGLFLKDVGDINGAQIAIR